jgi:hypothetical protein
LKLPSVWETGLVKLVIEEVSFIARSDFVLSSGVALAVVEILVLS